MKTKSYRKGACLIIIAVIRQAHFYTSYGLTSAFGIPAGFLSLPAHLPPGKQKALINAGFSAFIRASSDYKAAQDCLFSSRGTTPQSSSAGCSPGDSGKPGDYFIASSARRARAHSCSSSRPLTPTAPTVCPSRTTGKPPAHPV